MIYVLDERLKTNEPVDLYFYQRDRAFRYKVDEWSRKTLPRTIGVQIKGLFSGRPVLKELEAPQDIDEDSLIILLRPNHHSKDMAATLERYNLLMRAETKYRIKAEEADADGQLIAYWAPLALDTDNDTITVLLFCIYKGLTLRLWRGPVINFYEIMNDGYFPTKDTTWLDNFTESSWHSALTNLHALEANNELGEITVYTEEPLTTGDKQYDLLLAQEDNSEDFKKRTLGKVGSRLTDTTEDELNQDEETSLLFMDEEGQDICKRVKHIKQMVPTPIRDRHGTIIGYSSNVRESLTLNVKHSLVPDVVLQLSENYTPARLRSNVFINESGLGEVWLITGLDKLLDKLDKNSNLRWNQCKGIVAKAMSIVPYTKLIANYVMSVDTFIEYNSKLGVLLNTINNDDSWVFDEDGAEQYQKERLFQDDSESHSRAYITFLYNDIITNFERIMRVLGSTVMQIEIPDGFGIDRPRRIIFDILGVDKEPDSIIKTVFNWYTTLRVIITDYDRYRHVYEMHVTGSAYNYLTGELKGPYRFGSCKFDKNSYSVAFDKVKTGMMFLRDQTEDS